MRPAAVLVLAAALVLTGCPGEPDTPPPPVEEPAPPPTEALDPETEEPVPDPERPAAEEVVREDAAEGYTVQVAAFQSSESAERWTGRLVEDGFPAWTSVAEIQGQTFYRVRVGVTPSVGEARRLGQALTRRYNWPVWVAPLTPADRPPGGAAEATRRALGAG